MLQRIRGILLDNLVIKIFSLIFAVALWLHVVTRGESEVKFVVPLELKDVPPKMAVVSELPGYVDVRLRGQEGFIRGLTSREVSAFISLKGAGEGETTVYLSPSNIKVPPNIAISEVSPVSIKLRLDTVTEKVLPVKPVLAGRPAKGYRLLEVTVQPETVSVVGPKGSIGGLTEVNTNTVDIEGITGGFERPEMLEPPPVKGVKLGEESVRVFVNVAKARQ